MVIKILVVEDDVSISNLFIEYLTKSGFETKTAVSAEAADEILNIEEMNIVITDIVLPGIDGIQFTKNIRKKCSTDVIVMTGYSSEYSYEDAIKSGASDLIFKPVKLNELVLRINRVLRERYLLDQRDKMIRQLQRLTIEDPLTGLFNSRYLFDQLDKEINRAKRYLHSLSLMFIDIDKFKTINDTYGHMIGDKVLWHIANRLKDCLRSNDTAYRFGGDEYTIILPETTLPEAKFVADRIMRKFDHEPLTINDRPISKISLSIGITEYQINEGIEQLLHRADVTMYEAKQSEGNSLVITPELEGLSLAHMPQPSLSN
jgi:diguanylate cyclase (GGDEF)-like protein